MVLGFSALVAAAPSSTSGGESASTATSKAASGDASSAAGTSLSVTVKYFQMRQTLSVTEESFFLKSPAYFRDLLSNVLEAHPLLSPMMPTMTVLVDGLLGQPTTALKDGDEVDFLPAVVGG